MAAPEKQHLFCRLIDYYQSGDISTFERICNLAGFITPTTPRYRLFNYLNAASIAGFIEISETEQSTRWNSSVRPAIRINSGFPKLIETSKEALRTSNEQLRSLAEEENGETLIWGHKQEEFFHNNEWLSLRRRPSDFLGPSNRFIEQIIDEQSPNLDFESEVEFFNLQNKIWQIEQASNLRTPGLIRERRQYSGIRYRIILPELNLAFRILYPEWAYLATARVLRWEFDRCANVSSGNLHVDARFRLPSIIKRYLFANSESVTIGRSTVFKAIEPRALDAFRSFIWE